jgi:hypothetical protein
MKQSLLKSMLGRCVVACLGFGVLLGTCQQSLAADPTPKPTPKVPSGVHEYDGWAAFKEGSWCKHEGNFLQNGEKILKKETFTLKSVAPDKVTVTREAMRQVGDKPETNETSTETFRPGSTSGPTQEIQITEGDEDVTVGTEKIRCHFFKTTVKREAMARTWTIWISPKVPGGVVKGTSETTRDGKVIESSSSGLKEYKAVTQ